MPKDLDEVECEAFEEIVRWRSQELQPVSTKSDVMLWKRRQLDTSMPFNCQTLLIVRGFRGDHEVALCGAAGCVDQVQHDAVEMAAYVL